MNQSRAKLLLQFEVLVKRTLHFWAGFCFLLFSFALHEIGRQVVCGASSLSIIVAKNEYYELEDVLLNDDQNVHKH